MKLLALKNDAGPLLTYLQRLSEVEGGEQQVLMVRNAVRSVLFTEEGRILLDLLEKSTLHRLHNVLDDDRALAARNAQSFIAHDLRRIMSDELDGIFERSEDTRGERRGRRRKRGNPAE